MLNVMVPGAVGSSVIPYPAIFIREFSGGKASLRIIV